MVEIAIDRQGVTERGKRLEYFTIAWNSLEGLVALVAGAFAGSISLVGFGIDSFIEVTSGTVLLWRMSVDADVRSRKRNERLSLRIVGACFLALAVYVGYESASDLLSKKPPEHSIPGIVLACVSLVVMPWTCDYTTYNPEAYPRGGFPQGCECNGDFSPTTPKGPQY